MCVKVEVDVLDSLSLIGLMVSGCKATLNVNMLIIVTEFRSRSCVKVKVDVLGSPSVIVYGFWL